MQGMRGIKRKEEIIDDKRREITMRRERMWGTEGK